MIGGGQFYAAAGAVNQSGGLFNLGGATYWANDNGNCGYGGYALSGGTLNMTGGQLYLGQSRPGLRLVQPERRHGQLQRQPLHRL